ncbi:MAG TPA: hypothetical protein PLF26_06575 [Blastocatellia bacterium]|nr:hypothetical protein [Blastocatellia bacterium]
MALYYNTRRLALGRSITLGLMLVSAAILFWYPIKSGLARIVTGFDRVVFVAAVTAFVLSFCKLEAAPPAWIASPLAAFGVASYGVYILHPIVFLFVDLCVGSLWGPAHPYTVMGLTAAGTIVLASVLYERFEAPLIQLGKRSDQRPEGRQLRTGQAGGAMTTLPDLVFTRRCSARPVLQ